jgi:hypothetical protein
MIDLGYTGHRVDSEVADMIDLAYTVTGWMARSLT